MTTGRRVARDVTLIVILITLAVAGVLAVAWVTDFHLNQRSVTRMIAALILGGFGLLLALFCTLVAVLRSDHYEGRPRSPLHLPLIASTAALTVYFGVASISAVDVFYEPAETWPLLRDPGIRLIGAALVFGVVAGKAWQLVEILRGRSWSRREVTLLYVAMVASTVAVIWGAVTLGGRV